MTKIQLNTGHERCWIEVKESIRIIKSYIDYENGEKISYYIN